MALRNEVRHGSSIGVGTARKLLADALSELDRLLAGSLFLRDHVLFVARALNFEDGEFVCQARVLRGAQAPMARVALRLPRPVTMGRTYLATRDFTRVLDLHPFVIVDTCPICEDEEVFLYESAGADRSHFVSFQKGHALASVGALKLLENYGVLGVRGGKA